MDGRPTLQHIQRWLNLREVGLESGNYVMEIPHPEVLDVLLEN